MAIQTLTGGFPIPTPPIGASGVPTFGTTQLIDASGEKAAFIVKAPKAGNIRKIGFKTFTVIGTTTCDVRVETVDAATGDPSGTLIAASTVSTSPSLATSTYYTVQLTANAPVTRGQAIAIVFSWIQGSAIISNFSDDVAKGFPYCDLMTGGTWAKIRSAPIVALEYDDGSYATIRGAWPINLLNTTSYNTGSSPAVYALKFKNAMPFRVTGFWVWCSPAQNCSVTLYDSDGTTVLTSQTIDKDLSIAQASDVYYDVFPATVTLLKDTFYYLALIPSTTTPNVVLYTTDVASAAAMDAMSGGQEYHQATFASGSWTAVTTRRPYMGLFYNGADDGVQIDVPDPPASINIFQIME